MISCSLSPNTEPDDVWLALRLLFCPWRWKHGAAVRRVEEKLGGTAFDSGRGALFAILRSFGIGRGHEVICQAFTCVAVPDAVRATGATPVFVDIDETYTMSLTDVKRKITPKTKAIIVQHTFGISANIEEIKKCKVKIIEDFAHAMHLPLRGDAGFYSFGRDKVLSSVFGGMAVGVKLKAFQKKLAYPPHFWIFRQLLHPVLFAVILPTYRIGLGKVLLVLLQKTGLLSKPNDVSPVPRKYPNALALLLTNQLKKLDRYTKQREAISAVYGNKQPYLRFPVRVDNPKPVINRLKKYGILLGNWYHNVIDPADPAYPRGSCPNAEKISAHVVNLPTRISVSEAKRIWKLLS